MTGVPVVELRGVSKSFGERHVLDGIDLALQPGSFTAIVGCSGAGKTTLVNLAAGLADPTSGEILFRGEPLHGFPPRTAIVFQNYSLLPWFSALENVRLAVESTFPEWDRKRCTEQAECHLKRVGLSNQMHKRPSTLSGGQRQRTALARAFATEPEVLLLDEPFGALDALTRANLQEELQRMCSTGESRLTVLLITNSVDEAIVLADAVIPMTRGPKATLGRALPVSLPRPRSSASLVNDAQALELQASIVEQLTGNPTPQCEECAV